MKAHSATRLKQAVRWGGLLALGIGYALLSHRAAASTMPDLQGALVALAPLLALGLVLAWRSQQRALMLALSLAACAVIYGLKNWLIAHYNWVFLLQHAGTYALLCVAFGKTLQRGGTPMISRFATIVHGSLTPALTRYTRAATWSWTFYFGATAGLSLLLFWLAPVAVWSTFANLLGMPLLGLMFVGEYAARCYALPASERAGPLAAIRAYHQSVSEDRARRP
ncbi:MAG: hypothetical protein KJ614_05370 [Gammaproteobacteria bacterium]|uniref:hypothetical protein n=1 Tax=Rhodoferax sp. TaxID=50421 RepID=UPI00179E55E2|nr:hypothetical protein [Rhodoferax sp.]MBU3898347.1 hypothetical protein [Gammaproteobacteria bacterium]MBA3058688.1 hypothetical protein [Rhodoferax sp.]MBU3996180.1 hypothetical protein [Gammaproteobacteria bacterium]MBU4081532.1 hypothetical protein [Gammaproteobacteria bacterium]MBU4114911.1 hypothetical protein [Gammaproteobacteria bacterium]